MQKHRGYFLCSQEKLHGKRFLSSGVEKNIAGSISFSPEFASTQREALQMLRSCFRLSRRELWKICNASPKISAK